MKKHTKSIDKLTQKMTEYFDLCALADKWVEDCETSLDIAGVPQVFYTLAQLKEYRDSVRADLVGYCNIMRDDE